jgi:hypothetical protein
MSQGDPITHVDQLIIILERIAKTHERLLAVVEGKYKEKSSASS